MISNTLETLIGGIGKKGNYCRVFFSTTKCNCSSMAGSSKYGYGIMNDAGLGKLKNADWGICYIVYTER